VAAQALRHEALFYTGEDSFLAAALPFIRNGVGAGEPVLVALSPEKIELLRSRLDGAAGAVTFADMHDLGRNPALIIPAWEEFIARNATVGRRVRGLDLVDRDERKRVAGRDLDGELDPVETANWFPKVYRKDFKIGLNLTGAGVDDPDVQFYDYTKSTRRAIAHAFGDMPANYHLTFSRSECNDRDALNVLARGGNVAVVFSTRKGDAPSLAPQPLRWPPSRW